MFGEVDATNTVNSSNSPNTVMLKQIQKRPNPGIHGHAAAPSPTVVVRGAARGTKTQKQCNANAQKNRKNKIVGLGALP